MTGRSVPAATLAAAFKSALLRQGTVVFLVFVILAIAWVACRELLLARARTRLLAGLAARRAAQVPETAARRILRIGFGLLWVFDGLLQAQPAMPAWLPSHVLAPAAAGSPGWVQRAVHWAAAGWSAHPVEAAASVVWIQLGLGVWLLSSGSSRWSRLAGLVSLGWGLLVWVFGEACGGVLAPGQSWLLGAPGAALFYCVAGLLLALPDAPWHDGRLGRRVLRVSGASLLGFAVLQTWPGRGFWQGQQQGRPGTLTTDIGAMAAMRQPAVLHRLVGEAYSLAASHGFAVNLGVVIVLALSGGGLVTARAAVARLAVLAVVALCLADWVFVQDLGFLGGVGTDPNSMLPQALILTAGLVALAPRPQPGGLADRRPEPAPQQAAASAPRDGSARARWLPGTAVRGLGVALGTASTSAVLTLWAGAMVLLGAIPMVLEFAHPA